MKIDAVTATLEKFNESLLVREGDEAFVQVITDEGPIVARVVLVAPTREGPPIKKGTRVYDAMLFGAESKA